MRGMIHSVPRSGCITHKGQLYTPAQQVCKRSTGTPLQECYSRLDVSIIKAVLSNSSGPDNFDYVLSHTRLLPQTMNGNTIAYEWLTNQTYKFLFHLSQCDRICKRLINLCNGNPKRLAGRLNNAVRYGQIPTGI